MQTILANLALLLQTTQDGLGGGEGGAGEQAVKPWETMWFPLILIGVIFWFLVLGPERKQRRTREAMLAAVKKGDRVLTTGGIFGTVAAVSDDVVTLQIADGVRVKFARSAVQGLVDAGAGADKDAPKSED